MKKTLREVRKVRNAKQFDRRDSSKSKGAEYTDIKQSKNESAAFKKLPIQERIVQVKRKFRVNLQPLLSS
ncbi:hypothetical protein ACFLY1_00500 [Patescibacteria group bacterium]